MIRFKKGQKLTFKVYDNIIIGTFISTIYNSELIRIKVTSDSHDKMKRGFLTNIHLDWLINPIT